MVNLPTPKKVQLILVAIALLVIASTTLYFSNAKKEFKDGINAYEAFDCLNALPHFIKVTGFYKFASSTNATQAQGPMEECDLLITADNSRSQNDFASALENYQTTIELYPLSIYTEQTKSAIAETYVIWGNTLRETGDYERAAEKYNIVLNDYSAQPIAETAKTEIATSYKEWGDTLAEAEDYEGAIDKYNVILVDYSTQSIAKTLGTDLAGTYKKWGDALVIAKNYEAAIQTYELILQHYSDQPAAEGIELILAQVYLDYGDQLSADNQSNLAKTQYRKTIILLNEILNNAFDQNETENAQQLFFRAYDSIGQQLIAEKSFLFAMETYTEAQELAQDSETQLKMKAGYETAQKGLTNDTGTDGQVIIKTAIETACGGQPATSPVVGASSDESPRIGVCPQNKRADIIPDKWLATTPGNLRYVVDVESGSKVIQSCDYHSHSGFNLTLLRTRNYDHIIVYDSITGTVASQTTVYGSDPQTCPPSNLFSSFTEVFIGGEVTDDTFLKALTSLLTPLLQ